MIVTAGKTNVSVYYYIVGDAGHASPGEPVVGLLFSDIETGGSASYARQGAARVDLTLITLASASAAHADGGFILVDDTNMKGVYRCDYPDAAFATGVDEVSLAIVVAAAKNAVAAPLKVQIMDVDLRDAVRGGMTALPNAAAEAAGGLYTRGTGAGQINQAANGQADANVVAINGSVAAAIRHALAAGQMIPGTVDNTAHTPTTTEFEADDITEATADHFGGLTNNGRLVLWTSGALAGQFAPITDYVLTGGRGHFTVEAMTELAANNDTFILI